MPRTESRNYVAPEIKTLSSYHGSRFESLKGFNSDRVIKLNPDYTVSSDNTASTLSIAKAGTRFKGFGLEWENVSTIAPNVGTTIYVNLLQLMMDKAGFPADFWRMESDCTVSAECITQTFTKSWLRNNYKCWKALYTLCESFKVTTNSNRCGMHVNVDVSNFGGDKETQQKNIRKLSYLINRHYDFFCIALHRDITNTGYCGQMSTSKDYWKSFNFETATNDHYVSMNLSHVARQNRVEIRLVGGQKDYFGFRNTMEMIFHIIERVGKCSWDDLDDLEKVFKGCNSYVYKRLSTDCLNAGVIRQETVEKIFPTIKEVNYL